MRVPSRVVVAIFPSLFLLVSVIANAQSAAAPATATESDEYNKKVEVHKMIHKEHEAMVHEHMKWWKDSETVKQLQLSDDQVKQIEQGFLDHRIRLIDLHGALEKQELKLHSLLDADQLDESQINSQLDQVVGARGSLEKEHAAMLLNIRHVLTLEQWKKLQSLHGGMMPGMHHFEHHGDAGPPPPPPPPGDE